jgi:hypothetical protein
MSDPIEVTVKQFANVMLNRTKLNHNEISLIAERLIQITKNNIRLRDDMGKFVEDIKLKRVNRAKVEGTMKNEEPPVEEKYNDDTTGELAKEWPFFIVYYVYKDAVMGGVIDPSRRFPDMQSAQDAIQEEMQKSSPDRAYIFRTHSVYKKKEPVVCMNRRDF